MRERCEANKDLLNRHSVAPLSISLLSADRFDALVRIVLTLVAAALLFVAVTMLVKLVPASQKASDARAIIKQ